MWSVGLKASIQSVSCSCAQGTEHFSRVTSANETHKFSCSATEIASIIHECYPIGANECNFQIVDPKMIMRCILYLRSQRVLASIIIVINKWMYTLLSIQTLAMFACILCFVFLLLTHRRFLSVAFYPISTFENNTIIQE